MAVKIRSTHRNKQFLTDAIEALARLDQTAFSALLAKTGDSQAYKIKTGLPDGMLDLLSEIDQSAGNSCVVNPDSALIIVQALVDQPVISEHVKVMAMMLLGGLLDKDSFDQVFAKGGLLASTGPLPAEKGYEMEGAIVSAYSRHVNDIDDLDILMAKFNRAKEHSRQWAFHGISSFSFSNETYLNFMKRLAPEDQEAFFHYAPSDIFLSSSRREMLDLGRLPHSPYVLIRAMEHAFKTDDTHCFSVLLGAIQPANFLGYINEHRALNTLKQPDVDNARSEKQIEMSSLLNGAFSSAVFDEMKSYGEDPPHQQAWFIKSVVRECFENENTEMFSALVATIDEQKLLGLASPMLEVFQDATRYLHRRAATEETTVLTTRRVKMLETLKDFAAQSVQILFQASINTPQQQIKKADRASDRKCFIGPDVV